MASDSELRDHVQLLHEELESADAVDADARKQLAVLLDDIRALLDRSEGGSTDTPESLAERLEVATQEFETSHPTLYATVARVVDTLSNLGI